MRRCGSLQAAGELARVPASPRPARELSRELRERRFSVLRQAGEAGIRGDGLRGHLASRAEQPLVYVAVADGPRSTTERSQPLFQAPGGCGRVQTDGGVEPSHRDPQRVNAFGQGDFGRSPESLANARGGSG
ncbi:MAG: hypothetical protein DYG92_14070 [Leptolyngbya sp. PLA1]|nr:hypothetical protein [Leptolyngbya sp. PLA1]